MKVAVFSQNFGNFRNELDGGIDGLQFNKVIDYYFFTDQPIRSAHWKVINTPLQPELPFIDTYRRTAKWIKFVVPKLLREYDYIVYIDSKSMEKLNGLSKTRIQDLFKGTDKQIFFIKHHARTTPQEEIAATLKWKLEYSAAAKRFLSTIKDLTFGTHLQDTYCMVYRNSPTVFSLLEDVYVTLMEKGLRRDQNVLQFVLLKNGYEKKIGYFTMRDLMMSK